MRSFAALLPSVLFLSTVSFASVAQNANPADIKGTMSDSHRMFAYIIGMQTGNNLRKQLPQVVDDIDLEAMAQGIKEALAGQPPRLDVTEMTYWSGSFLAMLEEREKGRVEQNLVNGKAFRDSYAKREGVQDTGTGIYYKVLTEGNGRQPGIGQSVVVHYRGSLIDGRVFDDSYDRGQPQVLKVREVIPGWQEILTLMPVGSKWEAVIPPELAYGEAGAGRVGPNSTLVFQIELLGIE